MLVSDDSSEDRKRMAVGDEYEVVELRLSWGLLSLFFFGSIVMIRPVLRLLPWQPDNVYLMPLMTALAVPVFGLVGLGFGLLGRRRDERPGAAKIGVFLNAIAVGAALLVVAALLYVRYLR